MDQYSKRERLMQLFQQWCDNTIAEKDIDELMELLEDADHHGDLSDLIRSVDIPTGNSPFFSPEKKQGFLQHITSLAPVEPAPPVQRKRSVSLALRWTVAASLLLVMGVGYYFLIHDTRKNIAANNMQHSEKQTIRHDIVAPTQAAGYINFGDGEKIPISGSQKGVLASTGNAVVKKPSRDLLVFEARTGNVTMTTVTLPKGSQPLQLRLPDGTSVLLNVESSISFPSAFVAKTREVKLSGEGYFEVKHDGEHPFIVHAAQSDIRVLGTHFNVRAYKSDRISKITLTQGKVDVSGKVTLRPGQQAIVENGETLLNKHPDLDEVLAWKNNEFVFNSASLSEILSELSKWYNFRVKYNITPPKGHFSGSISKNAPLSTALEILKSEDIHFEIKNDIVTVY